jgi:ketohexokinase
VYAYFHIRIGTSSVDHYPDEDEKLRASSITRRRGGNGANCLEVLLQLVEISTATLLSLSLLTVLPARSSVGSQQIQSSLGLQVDLRHCIYRELFQEPASSYIIRSRSSGSRTIVNYNELPEMTTEEFVTIVNGLESETNWFHFEASMRNRKKSTLSRCRISAARNYIGVKMHPDQSH